MTKVDEDTNVLEILSNENLLKILSIFSIQSKNRNLTDEELADAVDTRNKILIDIFNDFDNQLDSIYKDKIPTIIFDRIISFQYIKKEDINFIQGFRNNKKYSFQDRSLIVSGLTISLLNYFDENKIILLIDFITNLEEQTWQRALVGLILGIIRYNNVLSDCPEILRRLTELRTLPKIQSGIIIIDQILSSRSYSLHNKFDEDSKYDIIQKYQIFPEYLTFTEEDIADIEISLGSKDFLDIQIKNLFYTDKFERLVKDVKDKTSVTMSISDFLDILNFEKYIEIYELNPFGFNLKNELFRKPSNWFHPLKESFDLANYPINFDLDVSEFSKVIKKSYVLSDIEKTFIFSHIKELSVDFLYFIYSICHLDLYYKNISQLELCLNKTIRDLYRFFQIYGKKLGENFFDNTLTIYNKSLLGKITDEITKKKIEAKTLYQQQKYQESLEVLRTIPLDSYEYTIYSLFTRNYIGLEKNTDAIPYLNKVLEQLEELSTEDKLEWYTCAKNLYFDIKNIEYYIVFIKKEILVREEILEKSKINNEFDEIRIEKLFNLTNSYCHLGLVYYNYYKDTTNALYYMIKYLDAFFLVPDFGESRVLDAIESIRESFKIIVSSSIDKHKNVLTKLEKEVNPKLIIKIKNLFNLLSINCSMDSYKSSIHYNEVLNHADKIHKDIYPFVKNKIDISPENEGYIFHFISNGFDNKIYFNNDDVIFGAEGVLKSIINYNKDYYVDLFLKNLFKEENNLSSEIKDILLEFLNWNLWDYNRLTIWVDLFYSFENQKKYNEASKTLRIIVDILSLLNQQPIEEKILWIEIAYDLFQKIGYREKQIAYFNETLKCLDSLCSSTDKNDLSKIIDSIRIPCGNIFISHFSFLYEENIKLDFTELINPMLFTKIHNLKTIQHSLSSDLMLTSKYYSAVKEHIFEVFKTIILYSSKASYEDASIKFTTNVSNFNLNLSIGEVIEWNQNIFLLNLYSKISIKIRDKYLNIFFDNFLNEDCVSTETIIDEVLLELMDSKIEYQNLSNS